MPPRRPRLTPELRAERKLEYNQCHALGHRWDSIPVTQPPEFGAAIDLRCENCSTVRRDILSRVTGILLARYYDYPEDYHDYLRHDKAWWRAAWLEKLYDVRRDHVNVERENAKSINAKPRKLAPPSPQTRKKNQK